MFLDNLDTFFILLHHNDIICEMLSADKSYMKTPLFHGMAIKLLSISLKFIFSAIFSSALKYVLIFGERQHAKVCRLEQIFSLISSRSEIKVKRGVGNVEI